MRQSGGTRIQLIQLRDGFLTINEQDEGGGMLLYLLTIIHIWLTWTTAVPKPVQVGEFVQQSCNDLDFGVAQVEQFMRDRPDTADIIKRHSMLRWILIWQFAGELKGERVHWDNHEPKDFKAVHYSADGDFPSLVKVSKKCSAVDQCAALLFELFNHEVDNECDLLASMPADKQISKDDFIIRCASAEFRAMKRVRWFFVQYPIRGQNATTSDWYIGLILMTCDLDTYLKGLKERDPKYWKHYERSYDSFAKPVKAR
jgi:hypothetical protein